MEVIMANCFAVQDPIFQRAMRLITSIANSQSPLVSTSFDHNYETGDYVRFSIPTDYGMQQIMRNENPFLITVVSPTTFTIDIDTTRFDIFTDVSTSAPQCAQVLPVGEVASKFTSATRNTL